MWAGQQRGGPAIPAAARDQSAALLPVLERVSGPEHPSALTARANLAYWTGQPASLAENEGQMLGMVG